MKWLNHPIGGGWHPLGHGGGSATPLFFSFFFLILIYFIGKKRCVLKKERQLTKFDGRILGYNSINPCLLLSKKKKLKDFIILDTHAYLIEIPYIERYQLKKRQVKRTI
jgi:hypothetical protein